LSFNRFSVDFLSEFKIEEYKILKKKMGEREERKRRRRKGILPLSSVR
jgi:hypothetical protein